MVSEGVAATAPGATLIDVGTSGSASAVNTTLTQNPELARIMKAGSEEPESLDEVERVQFSFLCTQFFDIFENLYLQYTHGALDEDFFRPRQAAYLALLDLPGFALFWQERREDYSQDFAAFVERERQTVAGTRRAGRVFLSD